MAGGRSSLVGRGCETVKPSSQGGEGREGRRHLHQRKKVNKAEDNARVFPPASVLYLYGNMRCCAGVNCDYGQHLLGLFLLPV